MTKKAIYTIKFVARQTGLKPHNIRSWEQRYNAVCPQRSLSNRRFYSDSDVERLRLLKQAVNKGHSISAVASLSNLELSKLVASSGGRQGDASDSIPDKLSSDFQYRGKSAEDIVDEALDYIIRLDPTGLEKILSVAAIHMPRQSFLEAIIVPLFTRMGELWSVGKMKIINEHMASVIVRSLLWDMLRAVEIPPTAPKIVIATPVGHWHEFGALASALAASESGWQVCYFGPNLPSEEIAYATKKMNAHALALSLCHQLDDHKLLVELKKIRRLVSKRLPIFIGGAATLQRSNILQQLSICTINDLSKFRKELGKIGGGLNYKQNRT